VYIVTCEVKSGWRCASGRQGPSSGLRKLASASRCGGAGGVRAAPLKRTMWSRRAQEYEAKINSGDRLRSTR
jgi:RNA polymerase-interacting CarD/CdnL/TRCF family regulator